MGRVAVFKSATGPRFHPLALDEILVYLGNGHCRHSASWDCKGPGKFPRPDGFPDKYGRKSCVSIQSSKETRKRQTARAAGITGATGQDQNSVGPKKPEGRGPPSR